MFTYPIPTNLRGVVLAEELATAGCGECVVRVTVIDGSEVLVVDSAADEATVAAVVAAHSPLPPPAPVPPLAPEEVEALRALIGL